MTRWKLLSGCLSISLSHLYWVISEAFSWAPVFPDSHSSFFLFPIPTPPPCFSLPSSSHHVSSSQPQSFSGTSVKHPLYSDAWVSVWLGERDLALFLPHLQRKHWQLNTGGSSPTPPPPPPPTISTSLLTSLLLSHLFPSLTFSPNYPLFPIVSYTLTQFLATCYVPSHYSHIIKCCYAHVFFCTVFSGFFFCHQCFYKCSALPRIHYCLPISVWDSTPDNKAD